MERGPNAHDDIVTEFHTYEDYLDSKITSADLYYLEDVELARQLVELNYRGSVEVLKREEFQKRKAAAEASRLSKRSQQTYWTGGTPSLSSSTPVFTLGASAPVTQQQSFSHSEDGVSFQPPNMCCPCTFTTMTLASVGKELKDNFLKALADREQANRSGKMNSIIFIRDRNALGQEISGYIDYSHKLQTRDFEPYFSGKTRLLPRPTDLSFYNWETQVTMSNSSQNYQVITDQNLAPSGLLFQNKWDRKILNVDPWDAPGDSSSRTPLQSELYIQVVIYDHITMKKA